MPRPYWFRHLRGTILTWWNSFSDLTLRAFILIMNIYNGSLSRSLRVKPSLLILLLMLLRKVDYLLLLMRLCHSLNSSILCLGIIETLLIIILIHGTWLIELVVWSEDWTKVHHVLWILWINGLLHLWLQKQLLRSPAHRRFLIFIFHGFSARRLLREGSLSVHDAVVRLIIRFAGEFLNLVMIWWKTGSCDGNRWTGNEILRSIFSVWSHLYTINISRAMWKLVTPRVRIQVLLLRFQILLLRTIGALRIHNLLVSAFRVHVICAKHRQSHRLKATSPYSILSLPNRSLISRMLAIS